MENTQADCTALRPRTVAAIRAEMPEEELLYGLSDFFKVMGDPTRINILWALEKESLCVSDLAVLLDMTKSAVSHQLKILRIAKLVRADKKGKNVYLQAGAGIVADSVPENEYKECCNKVMALAKTLVEEENL